MKKQKTLSFNRSLFIDSSNLEEIQKWNVTGVIDGVTTNQLIMLKDGVKPKDFEKVVKKICLEMQDKPVSVELTDSTATVDAMIKEAKKLNNLAKNIVVKVPLIPDMTKSLMVINQLAHLNIAVNVTVMMTFEQMVMSILAARHCTRLSFVSVFWGRTIEDQTEYRTKPSFMAKYPKVGMASKVNETPHSIVEKTASFLKEGGYENPKIIVGSIRTAAQVGEAFASGGHIITVTPDVLTAMLFSQRSIETIAQFDDAWKALQKNSTKS